MEAMFHKKKKKYSQNSIYIKIPKQLKLMTFDIKKNKRAQIKSTKIYCYPAQMMILISIVRRISGSTLAQARYPGKIIFNYYIVAQIKGRKRPIHLENKIKEIIWAYNSMCPSIRLSIGRIYSLGIKNGHIQLVMKRLKEVWIRCFNPLK